MSLVGAFLLFFFAAAADGIVAKYGFVVLYLLIAGSGAMVLVGSALSREQRNTVLAVLITIVCVAVIVYLYMYAVRGILWMIMSGFMIAM